MSWRARTAPAQRRQRAACAVARARPRPNIRALCPLPQARSTHQRASLRLSESKRDGGVARQRPAAGAQRSWAPAPQQQAVRARPPMGWDGPCRNGRALPRGPPSRFMPACPLGFQTILRTRWLPTPPGLQGAARRAPPSAEQTPAPSSACSAPLGARFAHCPARSLPPAPQGREAGASSPAPQPFAKTGRQRRLHLRRAEPLPHKAAGWCCPPKVGCGPAAGRAPRAASACVRRCAQHSQDAAHGPAREYARTRGGWRASSGVGGPPLSGHSSSSSWLSLSMKPSVSSMPDGENGFSLFACTAWRPRARLQPARGVRLTAGAPGGQHSVFAR